MSDQLHEAIRAKVQESDPQAVLSPVLFQLIIGAIEQFIPILVNLFAGLHSAPAPAPAPAPTPAPPLTH